MRARGLLLAAGLPLLLGGCLATTRDIRDLQTQMAADRAAQDSVFRVLIRRTEAMLDSLSDQNVRLRGDVANRLVAIERQLVTIQELTGQGSQQLQELRRQIDQNAEEARRQQQAALEAARQSAPPAEDVGDPQELYDAAVAALRRGSVTTARAGFEELLEAYPQHRLAADAQYNIGQAHEQGREPAEALAAYARVVELYPTSGRAPAALLRMGRIELARSNRTQARAHFNRIVSGYARSPEATEARGELQRMGSR
ncbi:MAG TPA: tetratricopeptide repeat protein [Longimicrobium sp.]|nr:tetratricopeptide repeat protein [Longimicrobium sp.]